MLTVGGLLATASSANASILASSRINFAMGRDKIVTHRTQRDSPELRDAVPLYRSSPAGSFSRSSRSSAGREVLATAASVLHLIVYALLNVGLIVFREPMRRSTTRISRCHCPPSPRSVGTRSASSQSIVRSTIVLSAGFVLVAVVWYFVYARGKTTQPGVLSDYISDREEQLPDQVVNAADAVAPNGAGGPTIMVALANPRTESA